MKPDFIYCETVEDFINDCEQPEHLVNKISEGLNRVVGEKLTKEQKSWKTTLIKMSEVIKKISDKKNTYVICELSLPGTNKRLDFLLVGRTNEDLMSLSIIELKGWSEVWLGKNTLSEQLFSNQSKGSLVYQHPSIQVENYRLKISEHCSNNQVNSTVKSFCYLPNMQLANDSTNPLNEQKYLDFINRNRMFLGNEHHQLASFLKLSIPKGIDKKHLEFLKKIRLSELSEKIYYREYLDRPYPGLDTYQNVALNTVKQRLEEIITQGIKEKELIIIKGGPGSGKSLLALELLKNIKSIDNKFLKHTALILPGPELRERVIALGKNYADQIYGGYKQIKASILIVDEAHKVTGQGTAQDFYQTIFRNPEIKTLILFHDDNQIINKKAISKNALVNLFKQINRNSKLKLIELSNYYRNQADGYLIPWLLNWIKGENNNQINYIPSDFEFKIYDTEESFVEDYIKDYEEKDVRISSFWVYKWNTTSLNSDGTPIRTITWGNRDFAWNPNWIWLKKIKENGLKPSSETKDLCAKNFLMTKKGWQYVGYYNTLQGSEFEKIYVYVPKLFFLNNNNELDVDLSMLDLKEMQTQIWMEANKPSSLYEHQNKEYFKNRLIINLTRGSKSCSVYFEDRKLSEFVKSKIINRKS